MNEQNQPAQAGNAEGVLAEMSLAEYRASRENPAAATPEAPEEESTAGEDAGENEAGEDTAEDTEQAGAEPASDKPKKKGGFQRKLEKQEREIEALKAQLAGKQPAAKSDETAEEPAAQPAAANAPKPKLDDFDSIEAYTDALTDWKLAQADLKREQAAAQAKAQEDGQKVLDSWNTRQAEVKKTHSDYDEVLESVSDIGLSPAHQRVFLESEHGPEIAYQLAQNPTELKKFAGMDPLQAARYFGKLEAALAEEETPEPKTRVSKAPPPIKPLSAAKNAATTPFNVAGASLSEYRKARESGKVR